MVAQAFCDFKTSTILVYMILNGKRCPTGCGLNGYNLVFIPPGGGGGVLHLKPPKLRRRGIASGSLESLTIH